MRRSRLLRLLALIAHAGLLLVLFSTAAYISFSLFVRSGVTRTPDLTGLAREEAMATLAESGLVWEEAGLAGVHSDSIPAGSVARQRPRPGSLVKRGSAVEAVLSLGPQQLTLPDLRGLTPQAAQSTLAGLGLTVGRTLRVLSPEATPGTVVEQEPAAAAPARADGKVDVLVALDSSTSAYLMPDLVYRDVDTVRRFFQSHGLLVSAVRPEVYEGIPEGVILRQTPLAGHPIRRHDAITLVVASRASKP